MKISKKIVTMLTIFSLVFGVQLSQPKQAHALGPTVDIQQLLKEFGLDLLVTVVQARIIDKMVNDTLSWAVGGFDGEPGFIENYDDFLLDVGKGVLTSSFNTASKAATVASGNVSIEGMPGFAENLLPQLTNLGIGAAGAVAGAAVSGGEFDTASLIAQANKSLQFAATYGVNSLNTQIASSYNECLSKKEDLSYFYNTKSETEAELSNFNQNDEDGLYELEQAIELLQDQINEKESSNQKIQRECDALKKASDLGAGALGGLAQLNYQNLQNGDFSKRDIAKVVGSHAAKSLNFDEFDQLIEGDVSTLKTLLGDNAKVKEFQNNIAVGGWPGYLALANPHNTPAGMSALVKSAIDKKKQKKEQSTKDDLQTPNKFLDVKKCSDGSKMKADGTCKGARAKIETITPGATKEKKQDTAQESEMKQSQMAKELSDVLASMLGSVANSLLSAGLSALGQVGGKSKTGAQIAQSATNLVAGNYQDQYDILGLQNDTPGMNVFGALSGGANLAGVDENGNVDIYSNDASIPFIGGPEDVKEGSKENVELIINLESDLENAYNLSKKYLDLLVEVAEIRRGMKSETIILDRCTPGPDYGWEDRFKSLFDTSEKQHKFKEDDDDKPSSYDLEYAAMTDSKLNKLALKEMRIMEKDPRVNIPGAAAFKRMMRGVMGSSVSEYQVLLENREEKQMIFDILQRMKDTVISDNKKYRKDPSLNLHPKMPIFRSEWNALTENEKLEILSMKKVDEEGKPIQRLVKDDEGKVTGVETVYVFDKYFLLKSGEVMDINTLRKNPEKARNAVLSYAWDVWRTQKGLEPGDEDNGIPSGKKQKSNLRYQYYIIKNKLATEANVREVQIQKDNMKENALKLSDYTHDCLAFWHMLGGGKLGGVGPDSKGRSYPYLRDMFFKKGIAWIGSNGELPYAPMRIHRIRLQNWTKTSEDDGKFLVYGSSRPAGIDSPAEPEREEDNNTFKKTLTNPGGKSSFIKIHAQLGIPDMSDSDVLNKLITERNKFNANPASSIFKTPVMFSDLAIQNSILNDLFITDPSEKEDYFKSRYPNEYKLDESDDYVSGIMGRYVRIPIGVNVRDKNDPNDDTIEYRKIRTDFSNMIDNSTFVTKILRRDYTASNYINGGSGTGVLFCRLRTAFDGGHLAHDQWISNCMQKWYIADLIDYEAAFSGIDEL